jgi:uncharacterized OsmC-like protein
MTTHQIELTLDDGLPDGEALLAEAFAACLLRTLDGAAAYLRFRFERASVRVAAERYGDSPALTRLTYELELDTPESPARVELLHRSLLRQGPVTSTLAKTVRIEGSVRLREREPVGYAD